MHIWDTCYGMQQYAVLTLIYSYRLSLLALSLSLFLPLYSSLYSRFKNSTLILWKYFVEFVCSFGGGGLNAGEIVLSVDISRILSPFLSLAVPL